MATPTPAKKFLVDYYARTLASIANRREQQTLPQPVWKFELPEARMFLRDAVKRVDDVNLHIGLRILVEAHANAEDEARQFAKGHVESVLNLISLSTIAFCAPAELVSVLEMTEGKLPSFRQYCALTERVEILASLAPAPQEVFRRIWDAYGASPHKARLQRAMSWLRKAISEENAVDEFTAYWIGLEVIKSILRDEMRFRTRRPGEWDGVREIFETELGVGNFHDIKAVRDGLLHGFRELSPAFVAEIVSYIEPVRRAAILSVGRVLRLEDGVMHSLSEKAVRRSRLDPWAVLRSSPESVQAPL